MARAWAFWRSGKSEGMPKPSHSKLVALTLLVCAGCSLTNWRVRECGSHGSLSVGQLLPGNSGYTQTDEMFHMQRPWTNLTVYCVAHDLPWFTLDYGSNAPSAQARRLGARVVRTGDGVVAKSFGLQVASEQPFRYDTSLVVLVGPDARVLRIWRGATVTDLDGLLKRQVFSGQAVPP